MRLKRIVAPEGAWWHIMTSIQLFRPLLKKRNNSITQICKSVNSFSNIFLKNLNILLGSGYTILFFIKSIRMRCTRCTFAHTRPLCGLCVCFGRKSAAQVNRHTRRFTRSHGAGQKVGVFHVALLRDFLGMNCRRLPRFGVA